TSGNGDLRDVLVAVYGAELARQFLEIGEEAEEQRSGGAEEIQSKLPNPKSKIRIFGFAAPPSQHRANRNHITLFVNGRWIKDKNLTYAIIQAYHTLLPVGRYPLAVVFVQMPLEEVDVNVHPTKTEVRFRDSGRVFGAVQKSVREAIIADTPVRSVGTFAQLTGNRPAWGNVGNVQNSFTRQESSSHGDDVLDWGWLPEDERTGQIGLGLTRPDSPALPLGATPSQAPAPKLHLAGEKLPIMRVVGQVGASYIITEGPEGIFLVDQHAAHERIMYEKFLAAHAQKAIASQGLVAGTAIHLTPDQATLLEDNLDALSNIGFAIEPFGPNAFMIRAVPAFIATQDPLRIVADVVADLERGDNPTQQKVEDKLIRRVCKTASIKQGQVLSTQEMDALIQQLEACENPHTCPHGRPTLIYLSVNQLAKEFGRT
ncbi:MAG: hypothetical protein KDE51_12760, partial [Anaerolineales bacterium]|nr:hypothetical protein [Anaerolineales bacterium]